MAGVLLALILFDVPVCTRAYVPNATLFIFKSGSSFPSRILDGLIESDIPPSTGKLFNHFTHVMIRWIVIILVYRLNGIEWHIHRHLSLTVLAHLSIAGTCSPAAHMSKDTPGNSYLITSWSNSLSAYITLIIKPLFWYLSLIYRNDFAIFCLLLLLSLWANIWLIPSVIVLSY